MARTIKDMPFWLWQAERLGKPYPENYSTAAWYETGDWPLDPAVRSQKARRKSAQEDRRIQHQRMKDLRLIVVWIARCECFH